MDLWIKSQDGLILTKVNRLDIICYKESFYITTNHREFENGREFWDLLGVYKTKERAIEILDDIQRTLQPCIFFENTIIEDKTILEEIKKHGACMVRDENVHIEQLKNYVYEMPKE